MSGDSAHLGEAMINAVQVRVDEFNAGDGLNGKLIDISVYDDENSPDKAVEIAKEIAAHGEILLVIGHRTSGASIAAAPIYQENRIPAISGTATADELTLNNPWYFRVVYSNRLQADFIANYINSILEYKTATLVSTDSVYTKSLANAFSSSVDALPLEISHRFEVDGASPDIDLDMADIVAALSLAPDSGIVFLGMNAANAAHFVREMRNSGFALPVIGPDSINQRFPSNFEPDPILKTSPRLACIPHWGMSSQGKKSEVPVGTRR